SALWGDLQRKADALVAAGTLTQARADELKAQARTALVDSVQPAYAQIIAWADAAAPKALVNPAGVGTTQAGHNGAEYYRHQLRQNTTTDLSAEQIHEIGLADVARIRGEMEAIQQQLGVEGELQAFFKHVSNNPALKYANTDAGRA